jgi:MFS family permease
VGTLLVIRRPRNSIGWLLLVIAFGFIGTTSRRDLDMDGLIAGTASTSDFLVAWFGSWAPLLAFTAFLALSILFPSGHLPRGRGRLLAILALIISAGSVVLTAVAPTFSYNPDGGVIDYTIPNRFAMLPELPLWQTGVSSVLLLVPIVLLVPGVVAMIVRFRRSSGIVRLQMRWLVASIAAILAAIVFGLATLAIAGDWVGGFVWIPAIVAYPTLPVAIYIAISRHGLYSIDRVISRTIAYAAVTAILAAAFLVTNLGLQALLADVTGGSTFTTAAATLMVAALFQPIRRRVQAPVDRRFNRARVDAQRTIDAFGADLRDEVDLAALRGRLMTTVKATMSPAASAVWIRPATETGR